ncbi:mannose-1-phosphate guanylyltransferase [Clostridium algidicarnis]|uniref:mannose-1-phosphate guanylyltransferase n=1 Tax=Clostridium algidicarnis TaxID=37659 RepID=UPI001C0C82D3|nr:mannose-1-phosphate guanylyltransferase [Clostridium algidicarnis]MBU3193131.1 mannose-1-phosphate guanylyltransferase [Clostridium algidicarnis]
MLCALIMAGGKGERFWPISTDEKPKQFLNILGEKSMIQHTVKRLEEIIPLERIFIVTASQYTDLIEEHLPKLSKENIIVEPKGKNTAPCIALSSFYIRNIYEDATIVVLPSDHLILDEEKFRNTLKLGEKFVEENNKAVLTIGIKPSRPDTGYGYIHLSDDKYHVDTTEISKVDRFEEKPCLSLAEKYVKDKSYLWNSGMFIWKVSTIIELTKKFLPKTYKLINNINFHDENSVKENYKKVDAISVDYGIMEKAKDIYVIPGDFGWDDLGSWNSLSRYKDTDKYNNVIDGSVAILKSKDNIIKTSKKTYIMGVENLIVIETANEIMIVNRDDISKIKELKTYGE